MVVLKDLKLHESRRDRDGPKPGDGEQNHDACLETRPPAVLDRVTRKVAGLQRVRGLPSSAEETEKRLHRFDATMERDGVEAVVRSITTMSAEDGGTIRRRCSA